MRQSLRVVITLAMVAVAIVAGLWVWDYYLYSAWTRDGRIRADIVAIAPDVSGWVTELNVKDNESVKQGEVLFRIDDTRYQAAIDQAEAQLAHQKQAWELAKHQYQRRQQLGRNRTISAEDLETARIQSELAKANYEVAKAELATQKINLRRTTIEAPANGSVVNLSLREGNYVRKGAAVLSLVKEGSFYATGYFEETKLPLIEVGEKAKVQLMAGGPALTGRVTSIAEGIANANTAANSQLLPQVQQVFNWVRLAQRIPVDIAFDNVPDGVKLSAGMTATITVVEEDSDGSR